MKKLLKQYDFNSDMQYFEMVIESFINGQRTQAITQFKALPVANRKEMVKAITGNWNSGLSQDQINTLVENI
jgi:hypothetical protein